MACTPRRTSRAPSGFGRHSRGGREADGRGSPGGGRHDKPRGHHSHPSTFPPSIFPRRQDRRDATARGGISRPVMRRRSVALLALVALLAGCIPPQAAPSASPTSSSTTPVPSTPTPLASSTLSTLDMTATLLAK